MDTIFPACNTLEDDRFESIEEFKDCIGRGDEIEFEWKGVHFGMSGCQPKPEHRIMAYLWNQPDTEQYFDTPDDALEYIVAGDRLRDMHPVRRTPRQLGLDDDILHHLVAGSRAF